MQTINYKSDFDFTFTVGEAFPDYDFRGVLTVGNSAVKSVVFSRKGDVFTNCFADGNAIHVVCKDHGLPPGVVMLELFAYLPDAIYSGGLRRVVAKTPTGIELTRSGAMWDGSALSADLCLPYALVTAYDIARAAGYVGTQEEFYRALAEAPTALQTLNNVNSLTVDWQQGKQAIADALSLQGQPSTAEEPFADLARKVLAIPRRAEGEDNAVTASHFAADYSDMVNLLHNHPRADYPYMCGVSMSGNEYILAGADAYLCSDGFFTTEPCTHIWQDDVSLKWIIYYFESQSFTPPIPTQTGYLEYVVYNGSPTLTPFINKAISRIIILPETAMFGNGIVRDDNQVMEIVANCNDVSQAQALYNCRNVQHISFPNMQEISGQCLLQPNAGLKLLSLPALRVTGTCSGASIMTQNYIDKCYLPALETINDTPLTSYTYIRDLYVPALRFVRNTLFGFTSSTEEQRVHLGSQKFAEQLIIKSTDGNCCKKIVEVTVEPGFQSSLNISALPNLTPDCLHSLILNLADNTDHATLTINMGATNLAKLSDSDRQIATDKNYTLC